MSKNRFIMSWGRDYQTNGKLLSLPMKRFISSRAKPLFYDHQGMGNYFTYREAIDVLGLDHTEVYKGGRIDLDPEVWSDLGWMCSYIGPPESAVKEMRDRCVPENIGPYPPDLLSELRDAAANEKFGRERSDDFEVIGVEGAQGGIGFTYLSYLSPGDEVIMPDPVYFHFAPACRVAEAVPVRIPLGAHNDHRLKLEEVSERISLRTKMIVLCDPINPFGTIQSKGELLDIVNLAREHDILIFNNTTHNTHQLDPQSRQYPIHSLHNEINVDHVLATSGISKGYGMAAVRLGFLAGHPDLLKAAAMVKMEITKIHTNLIGQFGALAAIRDKHYVRDAELTIQRNLDYVLRSVNQLQSDGYPVFVPVVPKYGFSMVLDVAQTGVSAQEICVALFKRNVAVYAGDGLGEVGADSFIRVNLSRPDLWAYEKLAKELGPAIDEAKSGAYVERVVDFFEKGNTARGRRLAERILERHR